MHVGRRSNGVGGKVFIKLDIEAGSLRIVMCVINVVVVVHGNVCIRVCLFKEMVVFGVVIIAKFHPCRMWTNLKHYYGSSHSMT